jgi:O-antigen ligase
VTSMYLYKGKPDEGLMGSRRGVWQKTWDVIKDHPWFGSGFGTSLTDVELAELVRPGAHVDSRVTREHGDSYLAITEWVGLLGVVPFYLLISMIALNARITFSLLRRTGDIWSPAVPAAAILIAGLVDAAFEDWMFAVGYYLCVFFWSIAFILVDLQHAPAAVRSESVVQISDAQFATVVFGQ